MVVEYEGPGKPLRDAWVADTIMSREDHSCRLTGQKGSWCDPLAVYPILRFRKASLARLQNLPQALHEMLCTFLGDDLAAWVSAGCTIESPVASHWLVLRSVAETFARGFWRVEPMEGYPSKVSCDPTAAFVDVFCKHRQGNWHQSLWSSLKAPTAAKRHLLWIGLL